MQKSVNLKVSSLFVILLIMVFLFTPFAPLRRVVIIYPLFALWLISTLRSKWIPKARGLVLCILGITILHLLLSFQSDYHFTRFISFNLPTALWALCFVYYSNKTDEFRSIVPIVLLIFLISGLLTIRANIILPGASRYLATTSDSDWSYLRDQANALHCGGYEFIFAIPFLLFPLLLQLKNKLYKYSVLIYPTIASLLACVIVGSYFSAILLLVLVIVSSRLPTNNIWKALFALLFFSLLLFALKDVVLRWLIEIGNYIDSPMLIRRAEQALYGTYFDDYEHAQEASRFARMSNAIRNIGANPLLGRLSGSIEKPLPSGHSELLGYFENFGLFGILYLIFYRRIYRTISNSMKVPEVKRLFFIYFFLFMVFLLIDVFDVATGTAAVVFFIAPLWLLLIDEDLQRV